MSEMPAPTMILPLHPQCDPSSDELSLNRSSVQGARVGQYVWNQLYKGGLSLPSPPCPAGPCSAAGIRSAGSNCRGSCTAEEHTPHSPSAAIGKGLSRSCSHHGCAAIPQAQLPFIQTSCKCPGLGKVLVLLKRWLSSGC